MALSPDSFTWVADLVRRRVADDVRAHIEAKGRGTVPAATARWASAEGCASK